MTFYQEDLQLVESFVKGDKKAWNNFVNTYSNYILANINIWCLKSCKILTEFQECAVQNLRNNTTFDSNKACEEGIELYVYIFNALKTKLPKYQGKSSLKTFITACLKYIYNDYFIAKYGKINIPTALKETSDIDKKVYKILCKSTDLDSSIEKLEKYGIDKVQTIKSFELITNLLGKDGKDKIWYHLYSQFLKNKKPEALEITNEEGETFEKDLSLALEKDLDLEILSFFKEAFETLISKEKRLLKLKFRDNLSTKDIFDKYGNIFKFEKENDVYTEIDKALKTLIQKIKNFYSDAKDKKVDTKEFKDALYDIFKLIEV